MSEIPSQLEDMIKNSSCIIEARVASRMPDGFYLVTVRDHVNTDLLRAFEGVEGVRFFSLRAPYPAEERAYSQKILQMMVVVD